MPLDLLEICVISETRIKNAINGINNLKKRSKREK